MPVGKYEPAYLEYTTPLYSAAQFFYIVPLTFVYAFRPPHLLQVLQATAFAQSSLLTLLVWVLFRRRGCAWSLGKVDYRILKCIGFAFSLLLALFLGFVGGGKYATQKRLEAISVDAGSKLLVLDLLQDGSIKEARDFLETELMNKLVLFDVRGCSPEMRDFALVYFHLYPPKHILEVGTWDVPGIILPLPQKLASQIFDSDPYLDMRYLDYGDTRKRFVRMLHEFDSSKIQTKMGKDYYDEHVKKKQSIDKTGDKSREPDSGASPVPNLRRGPGAVRPSPNNESPS